MAIPPWAIQLGIAGISAGLGALTRRSAPRVPDLSGNVSEAFARQEGRLEGTLDQNIQKLRDVFRRRGEDLTQDLAAAGATGSGGAAQLEALFRANNAGLTDAYAQAANALSDLRSREAAAVTSAETQEDLLRFQQKSGMHQATAQGITDLLGGAGNMIALNYMAQKYGFDPSALSRSVLGNQVEAAAAVYNARPQLSPNYTPNFYLPSVTMPTLGQ